MPARPGRRRIAADGGAAGARQFRRLDFAGRHARDGRDHPPRQEPAGGDADHGHGQRGHAHPPRGTGRGGKGPAFGGHDLHGQPAHRRLSCDLRAGGGVRRQDRAGGHRQRRAGAGETHGTGRGGVCRQRRGSSHGVSGCGLYRAGGDGGVPPLRGLAGRAPLRHGARGGQRGGHRRGGARDGLQVGRAGAQYER